MRQEPMSDEHEFVKAGKAPSHGELARSQLRATAVRERLRLVQILFWMTAVAVALAATRWLSIGPHEDVGSLVIEMWLAITCGTAMCSIPWCFARSGWGRKNPLLSGEWLWLLLAVMVPCRVVQFVGLSDSLLTLLLLLEGSGLVALTFVAAMFRQPIWWRVAFLMLAAPFVIGLLFALVFGPNATLDETRAWLRTLDVWISGTTMEWAMPVIAIALVCDLMSRSRNTLRWSHWVGGVTALSWIGVWYLLSVQSPGEVK
jgi:hypothetical protein